MGIYDVRVMTKGCPDFPEILRADSGAPSFDKFWTLGSIDLLDQPLVGFFCSRKCPGDVILRVYDLARAFRDAGIPVIGGFHSSMEKEFLRILLRGAQPIVICPARGIEGMRIPAEWRNPLDTGRLLVMSPFKQKIRRPTVATAAERNRVVSALSAALFIAHAPEGSKTLQLAKAAVEAGRPVYTFALPSCAPLVQAGATAVSIDEIAEKLSKEFGFVR